jgi:cysteine desulfurase
MSIYLDYAAATPIDEQVLAAMMPYFREQFYNPSSPYLAGRQVHADVEAARVRVAHWLGAKPAEIIFTAGATESVNLAIHGIMRRFPEGKVLFGATEHDAVRTTAMQYAHDSIPVDRTGLLDQTKLAELIGDSTVLVSIGYANSEIGTIQPLHDIAAVIARAREMRRQQGNPLPLYLHTDASQAAGYLDLHVSRLGVDLLTLGAGKIYGPKQSGILFVSSKVALEPLVTGGGQESGLRSGTENVPGIIGLATALDIAQQNRKETAAKLAALRDELQRRLAAALPDMVINGNLKHRLPNILHVSFPGVDGERLLMQLDEQGIQVATGSACAANKQTGSKVLEAIGLDETLRQGSLRVSVGKSVTAEEIIKTTQVVASSLGK